jgi:ABC-type iron transport system FetAB permease component
MLPFLFDTFPALWPSPPLDAALQQAFGFLSLPGFIVGLIFAGGYVHEVSFSVVAATNVVVYSLIAYGLFRWRHNRHERLNAA